MHDYYHPRRAGLCMSRSKRRPRHPHPWRKLVKEDARNTHRASERRAIKRIEEGQEKDDGLEADSYKRASDPWSWD